LSQLSLWYFNFFSLFILVCCCGVGIDIGHQTVAMILHRLRKRIEGIHQTACEPLRKAVAEVFIDPKTVIEIICLTLRLWSKRTASSSQERNRWSNSFSWMPLDFRNPIQPKALRYNGLQWATMGYNAADLRNLLCQYEGLNERLESCDEYGACRFAWTWWLTDSSKSAKKQTSSIDPIKCCAIEDWLWKELR
jgi:hypothetical protein